MFSWSSLKTRFLPAWGLLIATALAGGIWSSAVFYSMTVSIDVAVQEAQEMIDAAAALIGALEREDDALLLFLTEERGEARRQLAHQRSLGDEALQRIHRQIAAGEAGGGTAAIGAELREAMLQNLAALQPAVDAYRRAGDELLDAAASPGASGEDLNRYHREVNPLLRRAVAKCDVLREQNFGAIRKSAVEARDAAARAGRRVLAISALSLLLGAAVVVWQTNSVLRPIGRLTRSVDAIRRGDFDSRIESPGTDELGRMSEGFNQMAASLAEYRRSSLGELLESKAILRSTLDALPNAVLLFDSEGALADCNPPGARLIDAIAGSVHSRDESGLQRKVRLPEPPANAVESALRGRETRPVKLDFGQTISVSLDGSVRRLMFTVVPLPQSKAGAKGTERFGAVVVFEDVSDFVKLDELRGELIAMASHELKSPLTTLRMNLLMLQETAEQLDERRRQLLQAACDGCDELELTIEEFLDVTRVEAGVLRLNLERIDLGAAVRQATDVARPRFDDAGIELVTTVAREPIEVQGDAKRLASVTANLLSNALKYAPEGSRVSVDVRRVRDERGKPAARVTVTDRGPGIPPEYRERVFEKFFRVEHTGLDFMSDGNIAARRPRGTGIGLYLCREVIRAHGGTIRCDSGPEGVGTRVAFELPGHGAT